MDILEITHKVADLASEKLELSSKLIEELDCMERYLFGEKLPEEVVSEIYMYHKTDKSVAKFIAERYSRIFHILLEDYLVSKCKD